MTADRRPGKTIVLVDHPVGKRDDRASRMLAERGYQLDWRCPGRGDELPEPADHHVATVVYGGPESVNELDRYPYLRKEMQWIARWVQRRKAFLGICLGGQLLARAMGAPVTRHVEGVHEIGFVEIEPTPGTSFLPAPLHVYHWHNEGFTIPQGAQILASGSTFPNQAYRLDELTYGIQFHPEVSPSVLQRWLRENPDVATHPGAHPAQRQLQDSERYDAAVAEWLDRFFDRWLTVAEDVP